MTTRTSGVQVNRHFIWLRSGPSVVPASVWVLSPRLSMTSVQALILHGGGMHPQPVAGGGQAVDAHLAAAVGVGLCDTVVHERGYHCRFRFLGGLGGDAGGRAASRFRDWHWPPQPLDLHLGGACGRHGGVADQGDGAASF